MDRAEEEKLKAAVAEIKEALILENNQGAQLVRKMISYDTKLEDNSLTGFKDKMREQDKRINKLESKIEELEQTTVKNNQNQQSLAENMEGGEK